MTHPPRSLLSLVLFLAGCTCSGNAPTAGTGAHGVGPRTDAAWKGDDMKKEAGAATLQLDRMPAVWTFPADNLPAGVKLDGAFTVTSFTEKEGPKGKWYAAELPFQLPAGQKRAPPETMKVTADGVALDLTTNEPGAVAEGKTAWRIFNNQLTVILPAAPKEVIITYPGVQAAARRLSYALAKVDGIKVDGKAVSDSAFDDAFAHYTLTQGQITREGLLLNAPASGTWKGLDLPAGARFETWLSLVPTSLGATSDGAVAVLQVIADGQTTEVARKPVETKAEFQHFQADLSKFAGKKVDLVLRTEAGATPVADYVFAGSPVVVGKSDEVRRVFVIGIDTTRPDHFGVNGYPRNTTPELDKWSEDAVIFDRAWTSAPRTRPSFRAATTGRLPLEAVCAPNIGEAFDKAGFATAGIVSNIHLNPHFDFNKGFDEWWLDGKAQTNDQVDRAMAWLKENEDRDTYLFLHIMDPHIFYKAPEPYGSKFEADLPPLAADEAIPKMFNRWNVYKWQKMGKLSDNRKAHITAQYDGELAWTSHELSKLLEYIDTLPGKSLVIIHNDHGEEMWEHDGFEHNHTLYNDVTAGLLWIKPPGGTGQKGAHTAYPATLQDIAPTVYAFAGLDGFPSDGQSLLPALRGDADTSWTRPIPIGHLQYGVSRWGLVWDDHKYVIFTGTGEEELYDLAADPGEHNNLAGSVDTTPWSSRLGEAHKMDAGPGWRINVALEKKGKVTLTFPTPVQAADVLDPEYMSKHPANQEWGEVPKKVPADVAAVELSADKKVMTITPGKQGTGTLYVLFDPDAETPELSKVTVKAGGQELHPDDAGHVAAGESTLDFVPGTVIIPPEPEHLRMLTCSNGDLSADEMQMMVDLGYADKNEAPKPKAPAKPAEGKEGEEDP